LTRSINVAELLQYYAGMSSVPDKTTVVAGLFQGLPAKEAGKFDKNPILRKKTFQVPF
jgi:hypothetical protein